MSITKIRDRATGSEGVFQQNMSSSSSFIYTDALSRNLEEFSIEVTIGEGWNDRYSIDDKRLWRIEDKIVLKPHGSLVVEVAEEIRVPYNLYGLLLPTGSLFLARGVLLIAAKVEPAFHGRIKVRLFNTTENKVELKKGDKLGSIVFLTTESTSILPNIYKTSELSQYAIPRIRQMARWMVTNKIQVISWVVSVLSSSMLAAVLMYFMYYKPLLHAQTQQPQSQAQPAQMQKPKGD